MRRWLMLNIVLAVIVLGLGVQIVRTWARTLPPIEARAPGKVTDVPRGGGEGGGKRSKRKEAEKAPPTPATMVASIVNKDLFVRAGRADRHRPAAAPAVPRDGTPPRHLPGGARSATTEFILDVMNTRSAIRGRHGRQLRSASTEQGRAPSAASKGHVCSRSE
jgi:hypothetical protein